MFAVRHALAGGTAQRVVLHSAVRLPIAHIDFLDLALEFLAGDVEPFAEDFPQGLIKEVKAFNLVVDFLDVPLLPCGIDRGLRRSNLVGDAVHPHEPG